MMYLLYPFSLERRLALVLVIWLVTHTHGSHISFLSRGGGYWTIRRMGKLIKLIHYLSYYSDNSKMHPISSQDSYFTP